MPKAPSPSSMRPNIWGAITMMVVAAIDKGQLPLVLIAAVLVFLIYRMPTSEVTPFARHLLDVLEKGHIIGYIIALGAFIGWLIHASWQRRLISSEFREITKERDHYQEMAGVIVESSMSEGTRKPKKEKQK
jgi:hypothetical protein